MLLLLFECFYFLIVVSTGTFDIPIAHHVERGDPC